MALREDEMQAGLQRNLDELNFDGVAMAVAKGALVGKRVEGGWGDSR